MSVPFVADLAALIEFGGAVIITAAIVRALIVLASGASIDQVRLLVIAGSLSALGFKTAATLLKAIELGSWHGIGTFTAIFGLRTLIKQLFIWESSRLEAKETTTPTDVSAENSKPKQASS